MRFELKMVAIKLAGRYRVATEVKAFIAFESLSRCSLSKVRIFACEFNVPIVLYMLMLVFCMSLLVRKSKILCSCQEHS